jgi:phosphoribosylamine--glycine ligase
MEEADCVVLHAGTAVANGQLVTSGGRVLNAVALGKDLDDARAKAYSCLSHISFAGMQYRKDIGKRGVK